MTDSGPASGALQVGEALRAAGSRSTARFHLAGPVAFVMTIAARLAEPGVSEAQIHVEVLP